MEEKRPGASRKTHRKAYLGKLAEIQASDNILANSPAR